MYIGQTSDLRKRLQQHKDHKGSKYLKAFSNFKLVYSEQVDSRSEALKREYFLKQLSKLEKEQLIAGEKVDFNM